MKMEGLVMHRIKFEDSYKNVPFDLADFKTACLFEAEAKTKGEFLELAFEATNSIDYHWSENEGVTTDDQDSKRSTSVGDIVWMGYEIYMVQNCGFKLIKDTRF